MAFEITQALLYSNIRIIQVEIFLYGHVHIKRMIIKHSNNITVASSVDM